MLKKLFRSMKVGVGTSMSSSNQRESRNLQEDPPQDHVSCWGELPPEIWERVLSHVVANDVADENHDASTSCRLVCKSWEALIDALLLPHPHLIPTWNPYFDSVHGSAEELLPSCFSWTVGTRLSSGSEVKGFLRQVKNANPKKWSTSATDSSSAPPNPFVRETLIVEWRSAKEYARVMRHLPPVFSKFGYFITNLTYYFDPDLKQCMRCLLLIFKKLANLRSVTIYVGGGGGSGGGGSGSWLTDPALLSRIPPNGLEHLIQLNILGNTTPTAARRLFDLFCAGVGPGSSLEAVRVWLGPSFFIKLVPFRSVDTLKLSLAYLSDLGEALRLNMLEDHHLRLPLDFGGSSINPLLIWSDEGGRPISSAFDSFKGLGLGWTNHVRKLSVRLSVAAVGGFFTTTSLCRLFCAVHSELGGSSLEELYLDFSHNELLGLAPSLPLEDQYERWAVEDQLSSRTSFSRLTTLSLPYFMTWEVGNRRTILGKLAAACPTLVQLKLVYNQRPVVVLHDQEGNVDEAVLRAEVEQTWPLLPASAKVISVVMFQQQRRRRGRNVVWRFERGRKEEQKEPLDNNNYGLAAVSWSGTGGFVCDDD